MSDPNDLKKEMSHISTALRHCGYPPWSIATAITPYPTPTKQQSSGQATTTSKKKLVVLPYYGGVSEMLQRTLKKHGVHVCHKPHRTLRQRRVDEENRG